MQLTHFQSRPKISTLWRTQTISGRITTAMYGGCVSTKSTKIIVEMLWIFRRVRVADATSEKLLLCLRQIGISTRLSRDLFLSLCLSLFLSLHPLYPYSDVARWI